MADGHLTTPNPSIATRAEADIFESALRDLHGAASTACALLLALRGDVALPLGDDTRDAAIAWMDRRLSAAAENVRALYHQDPPGWDTMMDDRKITSALDALGENAAEGPSAG